MARKKRVTSDVLSSMKMLHTQGVKVSMIAKVLGFSNWTVYQGLNAGWDFDTYRTKQREHFDKQAKQVKSNGITMDDDISFEEDSLDKEIENKAKSKGSLKALLQKELLQSMITGENRPERIERSPMEDAYTSDPNPGFGITILDDLIRRALELRRFGKLPD